MTGRTIKKCLTLVRHFEYNVVIFPYDGIIHIRYGRNLGFPLSLPYKLPIYFVISYILNSIIEFYRCQQYPLQ